MKSVLLYGCETWLATSEIRSKIQIFVTRCLGYGGQELHKIKTYGKQRTNKM
jgi:hypothetical protein